ncbi:MAG TPA: glycoside hydrolase family 3 C-terminal domain-containing protein, partial [Candidatus Methylacidiphilales bacterium]
EDPVLCSALVSSYIRGVQAQGVAATVKHLAANNTDWHRSVSNSVVDERTLREVYLPAFETAIREAGVMSLMTSYNLLNGSYTAESRNLLQGLILEEWGFKGLIMSDWEGTWTPEKAFQSGLHLEMPGGKTWKPPTVQDLLAAGTITQEELDAKVRRILEWTFAIEELQSSSGQGRRKCGAHAAGALEIARKGVVLLKNENRLLPLSPITGRMNVLGPCAQETPLGGGGAADVEAFNPKSIMGCLLEQAPELAIRRGDLELESADAVIVCVGYGKTIEHEGGDRPFELPWDQEALVRRCVKANPRTIVVVMAGGAVGMDAWVDEAAAILHGWYPGEIGAQAIAEIVFGQVNPSGKLPISIERRWPDAPAFGNYIPDGGAYYQDPDYVSQCRPFYDVHYEEGVFCGYRHYDRKGTEPLFAFGHGLSYTSFAYSDLAVRKDGTDGAIVSFQVTNCGCRSGEEVAQVYVGDVESSVPRPARELKGFERIALAVDESKRIEIPLNARAFSFFDVTKKSWRLEPGAFRIMVGTSARKILLEGEISF